MERTTTTMTTPLLEVKLLEVKHLLPPHLVLRHPAALQVYLNAQTHVPYQLMGLVLQLLVVHRSAPRLPHVLDQPQQLPLPLQLQGQSFHFLSMTIHP